MADNTEVSKAIQDIVGSSPSKRLLGSQLRVLLEQKLPTFNPLAYGCRNLRDFIRRFATKIFEAGRSGGDVVYAVSPIDTELAAPISSPVSQPAGSIELEHAAPALNQPEVWKTYVSPSAPYRLYADPRTGELRVIHARESALPTPWIQVPPCPSPRHLEIAKEFTATVLDPIANKELTQTLSHSHFWWVAFLASTRASRLEKDWLTFRRDRLQFEFANTLRALNIPVKAGTHAKLRKSLDATSTPRSLGLADTDEATLRRVARGAIERIPASDLREIWLPLGYIVDELKRA